MQTRNGPREKGFLLLFIVQMYVLGYGFWPNMDCLLALDGEIRNEIGRVVRKLKVNDSNGTSNTKTVFI